MKIELNDGYFSVEAVKKTDDSIKCVFETCVDGSKHFFNVQSAKTVEMIANELLNILELMKCSQKQK